MSRIQKNIVLLSDGTGNSSAQLLKTNVWRIYEALQLTDPNLQVACYDDGVGTSSFAPLRLLGGAVGFGLRRNVLRLYRFLCEHYDEGDRIYVFGFSRGAFTVRVLVGLILDQGIVKTRPTSPVVESYPEGDPAAAKAHASQMRPTSMGELAYGVELKRRSRWAYRENRKRFGTGNWLIRAARRVRDRVFRALEFRKRRYSKDDNHANPHIHFVGVWDTVDAYGLPIDELTNGIDKLVWPLAMPNQRLHASVHRACHVLALDDERNTFHPVLWDEADEPQDRAHIRDERISQVWFAGMHANVGGGYSDDALSYVSLDWMATEAGRAGLLFVPEVLKYHTGKADPFGRIYDSRSGLKGYYRYNPRSLEVLTADGVTVTRPKIHESVFARIGAAPEAYAPIVLPKSYAIVRMDGEILPAADNPYESPELAERRALAQEKAWNVVWWRRVVYFLTVGASLRVALLPVLRPAGDPPSEAERTLATRFVEYLGDWLQLPDWWIEYYVASPSQLLAGLLLVVLLIYVGGKLQQAITGRMRGIWIKVVPPPVPNIKHKGDPTSLDPPTDLLVAMRRSGWYRALSKVTREVVLPYGFGVLILAAIAWHALVLADRARFVVAGGGCTPGAQVTPLTLNEPSAPVTLDARALCAATGIAIEKEARYRVDVSLSPEWNDGGIPVRSPAGFSFHSPQVKAASSRLALLAAAPLRRLWGGAWFVPLARVGRGASSEYALAANRSEFTSGTSGELFLYVNDAVLPWDWGRFYSNNAGTATVVVEKIGR